MRKPRAQATRQTCESALLVTVIAAAAGAWTTPASITNLAVYREVGPAITHDGYANLYVVWYGAGSTSDSDGNSALWRIWLQSHNGASWSPAMSNPLSGTGAGSPDITCDDGNNLHAVWDQGQEIYYSKRTAGAWSTPLNLSNNSNKSIIPKIAVDAAGNNILVTWHEHGHTNSTYDIITRKYTAGTWEPLENISNDNGVSSESRVAVDPSGNFHVIWQDVDVDHVYYRQRTAAGAWGPRHTLDTTSARSVTGAIAASPNGVVHVLFSDDTARGTNADFELYHAYFNGSTWSTPENISDNPGTADPDDIDPSLAVDSLGRLHAVWHEYTRIYYSKREENAWTAKTKLYGPVYALGSPAITVNTDDSLHVVWQSRPASSSDWDVYYTSEGAAPPGPRGTLSGVVRDQLGAAVPGAMVAAGPEIAVTGTNGSYSMQLAPATYSATAGKQYYTSQTVDGINITANTTTTVDFTIATQAPAPPVFLTVAAGNTQNLLNWKNSPSANFTGTVICYRTDYAPSTPDDGTLLLDRPGSPNELETLTHTGLTNGVTHHYTAFAYYEASTRFYSAGLNAAGTPFGPADDDHDGDVDQSDFGYFQACLGKPGETAPTGCAWAGLDPDLDVDQDDLDRFLNCYSGPGFPASPTCNP